MCNYNKQLKKEMRVISTALWLNGYSACLVNRRLWVRFPVAPYTILFNLSRFVFDDLLFIKKALQNCSYLFTKRKDFLTAFKRFPNRV